jgi:hypothetical protein
MLFLMLCSPLLPETAAAGPAFEISFPAHVHSGPITGRIILIISRKGEPEMRLQGHWLNSPPTFGVEVDQLKAGQKVVVGEKVLGYPVQSLGDIPPGDYYVQALLDAYTRFPRADGHVIWAHDAWEGQDFKRSPGNLYSKPRAIHIGATNAKAIRLSLTEVIPSAQVPADSALVKHVKIQSELLSKFWGHPIYLGAVLLLPRGYDSHPDVQYPAIYQADHFDQGPMFEISVDDEPETAEQRRYREQLGLETAHEFYRSWVADHFPRMIAVNIQSPTPFEDTSAGVNSATAGPYGDAIMTELIPYLETHFRLIRQPHARVLTGGSSSGWSSLALQLYHPEFFGGAWILCPGFVDFRSGFGLVNLYEDDNAFVALQPHGPEGIYQFIKLVPEDWSWSTPPERIILHALNGQPLATIREASRYEAVVKGRRSTFFVWEFGPVGDDGYPKPIWDNLSGKIDHSVANYMRDHGYDLREYAQKNWAKIGSQLVGKLHFFSGDLDETQVTASLYLLEDFLKSTSSPYYGGSFEYGRPMKGHNWHPTTNAQLVRTMAAAISKNTPSGVSRAWLDD